MADRGAPPTANLYKARNQGLLAAVTRQLATPPPLAVEALARGPVVTTGLGSSAAAARFTAHVFNQCGAARAACVAAADLPHCPAPAQTTLVAFSQGLSPNLLAALRAAPRFARLVLVTGERLAHLGPPDLRQRYGGDLVALALKTDDETGLLARSVGPILSLVVALQLAHSFKSASGWRPRDALAALRADARLARRLAVEVRAAEHIVLVARDHVDCFDNLRLKVLEGFLKPSVMLMTHYDFAHGYAHVLAREARCLVIELADPRRGSDDPLRRALRRTVEPRHAILEAAVAFAPPISAIAYECLFNLAMAMGSDAEMDDHWRLMRSGADQPLYAFAGASEAEGAQNSNVV